MFSDDPHDPVICGNFPLRKKHLRKHLPSLRCDHQSARPRPHGMGKGSRRSKGDMWSWMLNKKEDLRNLRKIFSWVNTLISNISNTNYAGYALPRWLKNKFPHTKDVLFSYAKQINQESFTEKRNALCSILLRIIQAPPPSNPQQNHPRRALPSPWFSGAFDHMLIWSIQSVATCKRVVPSLPGSFEDQLGWDFHRPKFHRPLVPF